MEVVHSAMNVVTDVMTVVADLHLPLATAQLARFDLTSGSDDVFYVHDAYRLSLSLAPRPQRSRVCFPEHWDSRRFERIGEIFLQPAGEVVHAKSDAGRHASIVCLFHAGPLRAFLESDFEWSERRIEACLDIRSAVIRSLIMRLAEEVRRPGFASQMLAELVVGQTAIELFRYCTAISDGLAKGGLAPWRLKIIDDRLQQLPTAPTLAELADLCDLSVRQLTRGFRASRGCSIGEYVVRSQIDHAKDLLATSESIGSIARSMGFASSSSFACAFRRAVGQTPRRFRQIARRA
jgi:AraC family transcriptional regulator